MHDPVGILTSHGVTFLEQMSLHLELSVTGATTLSNIVCWCNNSHQHSQSQVAITASSTFTGGGLMTTGGNIVIPNAGNIGSVATDAIAIASGGGVTFSQTSVHSAGMSVKNGSTSAGFIEFFEDSDNGTNKNID